MLIYDIEIEKAIEGKNDGRLEGIEYCDGWHDHKGMGISCVCAYDYDQDRYRTFFRDNCAEFLALALSHDILIGFNNIGFDNKVLSCHEWLPGKVNGEPYDWDSKSYDILREIWIAAGIGPEFVYPSHAGYGLDEVIKANAEILGGNFGKTGHGAIAPVDFQSGNYGSLVDYCLADVWLTKKLFDLIYSGSVLIDPKTGKDLIFRMPHSVCM
jgi:hypothetical protein